MIEVWGLFLFDLILEDADAVVSRYLDSKNLIRLVTENKAVGREEVGWINFVDYL